MRTAWLAVLVVLIAAVVCPNAQAEMTVAEVVQKVKPAVVTIITYDAAGKQDSQGTGFLVAADRVVTSYHVIDGAAKAKVKSASGKMYSVKGLAGSDRIADVAILALMAPVKGAKVLTLSKSLPRVGDKIVVIGTPLGLELTVTDGIVSAVRDIPGMGKFIQVTAPMSPGSSGSPVVNLKGDVVGVAWSIMTEGQNLNFAVPSTYVLALKPAETAPLGKPALPAAYKFGGDMTKGLGFVVKGEYEKALPCFDAATKADPRDQFVWIMLGFCYGSLGRYTQEADACKQAIRIDPDDAGAHCLLGAAYRALGRFAEAIEAYKQAIRINPDDADARCSLGLAYVGLGRFAEAADAFKHAIRINPDYALAHLGLGLAYASLGRYAEAVEEYKQAIRINPDDADAQYNLGNAYYNLGRTADAIDAYKQAIRIDPDLALAHCNLGVAYGSLGRSAEAVDSFKQAIRINPDDASAHLNLGLTHLMMGNKTLAMDEYKTLKKLDPTRANKLFDLIYK